MKAVVAAFNQEKALVGAFSVITNLRFGWTFVSSSTHHLSHVTCPCHVSSVFRVADMIQAEMWRREGSLSSCTKLDYGSSAIEQRFRNSLCIKEV